MAPELEVFIYTNLGQLKTLYTLLGAAKIFIVGRREVFIYI